MAYPGLNLNMQLTMTLNSWPSWNLHLQDIQVKVVHHGFRGS